MPAEQIPAEIILSSSTDTTYTKTWNSVYELTNSLAHVDSNDQKYPVGVSRHVVVQDLPNQPSIDFADASNRFYQVTISHNKTIFISKALEKHIIQQNGKVDPMVQISREI